METKDYLNDIKEIKDMMSQSTRFLSLSGLSGVLAGIYALIGGVIVMRMIEYPGVETITLKDKAVQSIIMVALMVLLVSVSTAYFMTVYKSRKIEETLWNAASKRLVINFSIPLATGGIFCLLILEQGFYELIAPSMLLFYGLACVNSSKYTLRDMRYLGLTQIVLGLIAIAFLKYSLYFWMAGFGVCHIIYGLLMHFKYDSK